MNSEPVKVRIDKWLWSVRLYKTRSLAAEACEKGRVVIGENEVKPGKIVRQGETIRIHRGPWHQTVKVLLLIDKRVSAALVKEVVEDITPPEEIERLKLHQAARAAWNIQGNTRGRPTKKDRRDMEEFMGDFFDE